MSRKIMLTLLALLAGGACGCASGDVRDRRASKPPETAQLRARAASALQDAPKVRRLGRAGWVRVELAIAATDQESPQQARKRALTRARQAAVEYVAGVDVRSSLLSLEQARGAESSSLVQLLAATQSRALVVSERLRRSDLLPSPGGGFRIALSLDAQVLVPDRSEDEGLQVEVRLSGDARLLDGEALAIATRASQDGRLYLVSISDAGATLLLPNRHLRDTRVRAGQWLVFPDQAMAARGIRLEARVTPGQEEVQEAILAIALRGDRRLEDAFPASADVFRSAEDDSAPRALGEMLAPLLEMDAEDWGFDQQIYRVLAR